jgi:hypothetical protein
MSRIILFFKLSCLEASSIDVEDGVHGERGNKLWDELVVRILKDELLILTNVANIIQYIDNTYIDNYRI